MIVIVALISACSDGERHNTGDDSPVLNKSWQEILNEAGGTKITMMMWMGDPLINNYMNGYVVPNIKEQFDIDLEIVSGQGAQIVSTLMSELESGRNSSQIDLIWLNGETFFQLRMIDALFGPFTEKLPNIQYVDMDNPFIGIDFQQPVNGYEAPWGNVQLAFIYNTGQIDSPPQSLDELKEWVRENPGRFTIPTEFTGMTVLKSMMISMAEDPDLFKGEFNAEVYNQYSSRLWNYINEIKPFFWREGETFPNSISQMHQFFANGELNFTFSNNDSEVDNKILQGLFPENSRAYVPDFGTIRNTHYLGIPTLASDKEAAMAVINFLLSPEAQFEKMKPEVWGDGTILDMSKLPENWQKKFSDIPGRTNSPPREQIREKAFMEPAPEYMIRIFEDFRTNVVN
ncbi:MAG TPA: ABC transporter substrate-binding protein [Balneolaceae bacterium]|nr:ABC transporter substrate-binding protein [Balneolaceae bacterium]